jgi:hypothetical protein
MYKIEAQILYNEIRDEDSRSGLYVWVDPDEQSILKLRKFVQGAPFKPLHSTDFHVTVLYHKEALPFGVKPPMDRRCTGSIVELKIWPDKRGRNVLVALLDSPDLQMVHSELLGEGLQHSFPDFNAHITLCYETQMGAALRLWIEQTNERLKDQPVDLSFDPKLKAEALN